MYQYKITLKSAIKNTPAYSSAASVAMKKGLVRLTLDGNVFLFFVTQVMAEKLVHLSLDLLLSCLILLDSLEVQVPRLYDPKRCP